MTVTLRIIYLITLKRIIRIITHRKPDCVIYSAFTVGARTSEHPAYNSRFSLTFLDSSRHVRGVRAVRRADLLILRRYQIDDYRLFLLALLSLYVLIRSLIAPLHLVRPLRGRARYACVLRASVYSREYTWVQVYSRIRLFALPIGEYTFRNLPVAVYLSRARQSRSYFVRSRRDTIPMKIRSRLPCISRYSAAPPRQSGRSGCGTASVLEDGPPIRARLPVALRRKRSSRDNPLLVAALLALRPFKMVKAYPFGPAIAYRKGRLIRKGL